MMRSLEIQSAQGPYTVSFIDDLRQVVERARIIRHGALVVDRNVAKLYEQKIGALFGVMPTLLIDATEDEKSLAGVAKVATWLQELNGTKQTHLVAIGGGIIQDICTLAAHIYYRGIKWTYIPTTLLSMADSCIGAKGGVNHNLYKNQLGAFHSPSQVLLCPKFTETLSDADVASGYGEILKLHVTGAEGDFRRLERALQDGGMRGPALRDLIYRSLEVKKGVIEVDEYEKDLRRILNYGHTFGHALETVTQHEVPHGLAVAWGMDLVNFVSMRRGLLAESVFGEVHEFIRKRLPFKLSRPVRATDLIQGSRRDKKVADGQIALVLLEKLGSLKIVKFPFDSTLEGLVAEYVEKQNVFA